MGQHIGVTTSTCQVTWRFLSRDLLIPHSPGAISYRCSIVTESLSPAIFRIMGSKHIGVTIMTFLGHVTNRSATCHFLLVSHCNRTSISNRFRDIRPPKPVRTHRHTPQVILYSVPRKWRNVLWFIIGGQQWWLLPSGSLPLFVSVGLSIVFVYLRVCAHGT